MLIMLPTPIAAFLSFRWDSQLSLLFIFRVTNSHPVSWSVRDGESQQNDFQRPNPVFSMMHLDTEATNKDSFLSLLIYSGDHDTNGFPLVLGRAKPGPKCPDNKVIITLYRVQ